MERFWWLAGVLEKTKTAARFLPGELLQRRHMLRNSLVISRGTWENRVHGIKLI